MDTNKKATAGIASLWLFGVALSALGMWLLSQSQHQAAQQRFQQEINERALALHRDIILNLEGLHTLSVLFAQQQPSFEAFQREAELILTRHPDIQALEWVPKIAEEERAAKVQQNRLLFRDFDITERQSQGRMVSAAQRSFYFPVYYVVPLRGNENALGFDLASNAVRLTTLRQSQDTARPLASASITLVQEHHQQKGFLAFLPIYQGTPLTVTARRQQLQGFVLGVYRIGDIVSRSAFYRGSGDIELTLVDTTDRGTPESILHAPIPSGERLVPEFSYEQPLPDIWGRSWTVRAVAGEGYVAASTSWVPISFLLVGSLFSTLFCLLCLLMLQQSTRVKQQVAQKTAELNEANQQLSQLAKTDPLTGIANRRAFNDVLSREWQRAHRNGSSVALLMVDIDHFKAYNDHHGHPLGDQCLQQVAGCLQQQCRRSGDSLSRYGGEEFAIILPDTDKPMALAQQCVQAVAAMALPHGGLPGVERVTISVGVAVLTPRDCTAMADLLQLADEALYQAKLLGRNRAEQGYPKSANELLLKETEAEFE